MMNIDGINFRLCVLIGILTFSSCVEKKDKKITAQEIVDKSIAVCGSQLFTSNKVSFDFRKRRYISEYIENKEFLTRITQTDSGVVKDVRNNKSFTRFVGDTQVILSDSVARLYSNAVNSVHYFSKLPYGLNDSAVKKELIEEVKLDNKVYYKMKVTFNKEGGGDDYEDTFLYWINKETFKPDFLGYTFLTDGGGTRFRIAYNERYINGIRFVDYKNFKPNDSLMTIFNVDSLYFNGGLKLLSTIELENISVNQGSYN